MNKRAIRTLAFKAFRNTGGMGAQASNLTFFITLFFALAYLLVIGSYVYPYRLYELLEDKDRKLIVVNEPTSFCQYLDSIGIPHTNNNNFETDAYYDFRYFEQIMEEHGSIVAIVFPQDFDEMVFDESGTSPEILTYIKIDDLDNYYVKENVIDTILANYTDYLKSTNDKMVPIYPPTEIYLEGTPTEAESNIYTTVASFGAKALTPILLFLAILYASMNSGTNIIAGEKERGTFAAILLSPVSRLEIMTGDLLGVSLGSLIPSTAILLAVFFIPGYSGPLGFIVALPLLISLVLLIASLTLLISVISDSVVSAQTAFLPLFFIIVTICVTCIQNVGQVPEFYYLLPVYGHFYGLGDIIYDCSLKSVLLSTGCIFSTLVIVAASLLVSVKLLGSERFTVNAMSSEDHEKAPAAKLTTKTLPEFIIDQAVYPLVILSIFQTLAMVPVFVKYTATSAFADLVESMKAVHTFQDVFTFSFDLLGLFLSDPLFIICMSVGYVLMMACYLIKVMLKEKVPSGKGKVKKHLATLGFELNKSTPVKYFGGILLGIALMSGVYLILNVTGQVTFDGFTINKTIVTTVLISILMWIPQGACEELMFRGYMLPRITQKTNRIFAYFLSSFLFSVLHSLNAGYTPMASVNLFLIALLFALISYRSGSIWITCGAHTAWNFCQGNLYGLQVSGNELSSTLIKTTYTKEHLDIITGGAFGPEGGLAVTAITLPLVILLIFLIKKDSKKTSRLW